MKYLVLMPLLFVSASSYACPPIDTAIIDSTSLHPHISNFFKANYCKVLQAATNRIQELIADKGLVFDERLTLSLRVMGYEPANYNWVSDIDLRDGLLGSENKTYLTFGYETYGNVKFGSESVPVRVSFLINMNAEYLTEVIESIEAKSESYDVLGRKTAPQPASEKLKVTGSAEIQTHAYVRNIESSTSGEITSTFDDLNDEKTENKELTHEQVLERLTLRKERLKSIRMNTATMVDFFITQTKK